MPHVVALALIGAGLYAGYRWLPRESEDLESSEDALGRETARRLEKNLGSLEYDAVSGVYRPAKRD